jgi:hypothetical protein
MAQPPRHRRRGGSVPALATQAKELPMRRILSLFTTAVLLAGSLALSGCVVVPAHRARVWVPGYWAPRHVWVEGHWRYR